MSNLKTSHKRFLGSIESFYYRSSYAGYSRTYSTICVCRWGILVSTYPVVVICITTILTISASLGLMLFRYYTKDHSQYNILLSEYSTQQTSFGSLPHPHLERTRSGKMSTSRRTSDMKMWRLGLKIFSLPRGSDR